MEKYEAGTRVKTGGVYEMCYADGRATGYKVNLTRGEILPPVDLLGQFYRKCD